MSYLRFLIFAGATFALLIGSQSTAAEAPARPNIVLIMADDLGYECIGANGGESYSTPHLDKLARQGVHFANCHSQPICTPTRVQIMSGRYNSRNYVRFGMLDPSVTTFGNVLREAGYATGITGKWQLGGGIEGPGKFGFDEHCLWQLTRRPNRYPNPGLEINGNELDFRDGQYGPDIINDFACKFIDEHAAGDKPFLLYYPMVLAHWPFEPTPDSPDWDPNARRDDAKELGANMTSQRHFADMVNYTDKMVGKLIAKLEEAGVRDNTLLIFTGDNGTYGKITSKLRGEPYQGGKGKLTQNGTHVPLIIDWPGTAKAGSVCEDLIDFTDVFPTLLETAGVTAPHDLPLDGRSFLPQVKGERGVPRDWVYCWYSRNGKPFDGEFAMTHRYKLYGDDRFFDLQNDPWEKSPIQPELRSADHQQTIDLLREAIQKHTRKPKP